MKINEFALINRGRLHADGDENDDDGGQIVDVVIRLIKIAARQWASVPYSAVALVTTAR